MLVESREAAAFLIGVRFRAFTIAFTAPVAWSRTTVEAGMPRVSDGSRGTQTSFTVVSLAIRAGMNKAV